MFSILLFYNNCIAQTGTLQGILYDNATNETLVGVNISTQDNHGVSSDENGNYSITLDTGKYTITFSFVGYQTKEEIIEIFSGDVIDKKFI